MECSRCRQRYDQETRLPKLLPCGHTFCLPCLQGATECFSDGQSFPGADNLPEDLYALSMVTGDIRRHPDEPPPGALQLWCRGCAAAATDTCVDGEHELVTARVRWHEVVLEQLEALAAALESDPHEEDELLEQLVDSAGVQLTLKDGEDEWTSTVQLGGSGEESTEESWALRDLLLRALRGQAREDEKFVEQPDTRPAEAMAVLGLGSGLFDADPAKDKADADFASGFGLWDHLAPPATKDDVDDLGGFDLFSDDPVPHDEDDDDIAAHKRASEDATTEELAAQLAVQRLSDEVRKILALNCVSDPLALELLRQAAPHLEELQVTDLTREHLLEIQRMPRLRRLEVTGKQMWVDPFRVPPLEHDGGLEFLKVCLCEPTVASLMYAHNRTLRQVQILVPPQSRRTPGNSGPYFDHLDYLGSGLVGENVFRSPFFPRREPGDFPVLERVEFVDAPRSPYAMRLSWIMGKDMDKVERALPGVKSNLVFKPKHLK